MMRITTESGGITALWQATLPSGEVGIAWLGQAGFAIRSAGVRVVIDPYLSNSLAEKYRGTVYPHIRMMPPPILPAELTGVDYVFITHRHTDHMDRATIVPLAAANPTARFVAPASENRAAGKAGMPPSQTLLVDAGQTHRFGDDLIVAVLPAAHDELLRDDQGHHHFLGYTLRIGGLSIYHPGDTVPYAGWEEQVGRTIPAIALLPVNGRDAARTSRGVIGNMNFDEAVHLCTVCGIGHLIPHHFGLFDFNTVDVDLLRHQADCLPKGVQCTVPDIQHWYRLQA